jgi:hypothetical protein
MVAKEFVESSWLSKKSVEQRPLNPDGYEVSENVGASSTPCGAPDKSFPARRYARHHAPERWFDEDMALTMN